MAGLSAVGDELDPQVQEELAQVNGFSAEQLGDLGSVVLDLLRDPRHSAFQERLAGFAETHRVNVSALKNVARGMIMFFRRAMKHSQSADQVSSDLQAMGISEAAAGVLGELWREHSTGLATSEITKTVMANQLVDMEWKFGVTASSDEVNQVGSTFLHLKLVVDRGSSKYEDVHMELSLPQFYQFMADMEKAKTFIDILSS